MSDRRLGSVLLPLCLALILSGCAGPGPSPGEADDRLEIHPITPEASHLTVEAGESVTFVVECQPPGGPEEVVVEWEQAIRHEGVEDEHRDFQSSEEASTFTVGFERAREHIVTAVCTTSDDRTQPHLWNVTVRDGGSDGGDSNATARKAAGAIHVTARVSDSGADSPRP